jgi:hypothetical protein
MAAAFFDITPSALRMKEYHGYFVNVQNEDLSVKRTKTKNGGYEHRKYSLYDLRRIAHSFRAHGKLSDRQLSLIIMRLDSFAEPIFIRKRKHMFKVFREPNVR